MKLCFLAKTCILGLLLVLWPMPAKTESCPSVCVCKWKSGKQTVECLERALITIPENIDSETQVLDVSGNNLQIIPRETFFKANLTNLQRVYLKSCRIGQIGERAFRGLTNLVELDLSHNLLTAVPSAVFEDTPFLRYLSLANNPIQKIEANAFATVPGLAKIDLSHCEIKIISPNAFDHLEYLEWLKLNGNRLTEMQPKTVEAISKLHGIELHDNPWTCDCKLRSAKEWLALNNIPHPVVPVCRGPERVTGRSFAELSIDDFACRPEVLPVSRYIEATTGENATVTCRVGAVPFASIHWYWNGRLLLNNTAFSAHQKVLIFEEGNFEKTSTLVLTNALETDSGDFYCVAENRAGTAEANFTLHVSMRTAGMAPLNSGQIAGLSAALVILILAILLVALVLLIRLRRLPLSESKTPGRLEVIATMNGNGVATTTKPMPLMGRVTSDQVDNKTREIPLQYEKSRAKDSLGSNGCDAGDDSAEPSSGPPQAGNNPDIIRDAKLDEVFGLPCYPLSPGAGVLRPTASLQNSFMQIPKAPACEGFDASDKTPIISEEDEDYRCYLRSNHYDYPPDYGLPIFEQSFGEARAGAQLGSPTSSDNAQHPSAKTLRVWQRGVPVLPPATAFKRVLSNSRNSPDEGYQEGCGTDV